MKDKIKVIQLEHTPNPLDVIYAACRQCYTAGFVGDTYPNTKVSQEKKEELINAVISSGHTSTIEHVTFTFAIEGISRALTHQLVRHRIASYSQQSQRYVGKSKELGFDDFVTPPSIQANAKALILYKEILTLISKGYTDFNNLFPDIPAEDVRFLLPNAKTSAIVVSMNCRSLLNFFGERCCTCAQWEVRDLAWKLHKIVSGVLPVVFKNRGPKCDTIGYCTENEDRWCGRKPHKTQFFGE